MVFKLQLRKKTEELANLIQEIDRLSTQGKNFILGFNPIMGDGETTLYLQSCKGLQKNAFAHVQLQKNLNSTLCIINYAISVHANISVSLEKTALIFEISARPELYKIIEMFASSVQ